MKRLSIILLISIFFVFTHSMDNQSDSIEEWATINAMVINNEENQLLFFLNEQRSLDSSNYHESVYCALECALRENEKLISIICQNFMNVIESECDAGLLHLAASNNNVMIIQHLIDHGACVDELSAEGKAPIHYAIDNSSKEFLKALVEIYRCDIHIRANHDDKPFTPLELAIFYDDLEIYEYLMSQGARSDLTIKGRTALHIAAENSKLFTQYFLQQGFNSNQQDQISGSTPLHYATRRINQAQDRINILIAGGANPAISDDFGNLPFMTLFHSFISPIDGTYDDDHTNYSECAAQLSQDITLTQDQAFSMLCKCLGGLYDVDQEVDQLCIRKFMQCIVRALDLEVVQADNTLKMKMYNLLKSHQADQFNKLTILFKKAANSTVNFIETRENVFKSLTHMKNWDEVLGFRAYVIARHGLSIKHIFNPPSFKQLLLHAMEINNIILIHFCASHSNVAYKCSELNPLYIALEHGKFNIALLLISFNKSLYPDLLKHNGFKIEEILNKQNGQNFIFQLLNLVNPEEANKENSNPDVSEKRIQCSSPDKKRRKSLSPEK